MKTLLEVIKLNKGNIDKIQIPKQNPLVEKIITLYNDKIDSSIYNDFTQLLECLPFKVERISPKYSATIDTIIPSEYEFKDYFILTGGLPKRLRDESNYDDSYAKAQAFVHKDELHNLLIGESTKAKDGFLGSGKSYRIKKYYKYNMKNIITYLNENLIIEAFASEKIRFLNDLVKRHNKKFKSLTSYYSALGGIKFDQISDDDVEVLYDNFDVLLKEFRKVRKGTSSNKFVLFCLNEDDKINLIVNPMNDLAFVRFNYNDSLKSTHIGGDKGAIGVREAESIIQESDVIFKINNIDKYDTNKERTARRNGKEGMIPDRTKEDKNRDSWSQKFSGSYYQYCSQLASDNNKKYKDIIAKRKAEEMKDTSKIDNMIKNVMDRMSTSVAAINKDSSGGDGFNGQRASYLCSMVSKILNVYSDYCKNHQNMLTSAGYSEFYLNTFKKLEQKIIDSCEEFNEYIDKYNL